ncbi:MAG: hypothetical protein PWP38_306 [Clostridiales bacterium]|nr:hypothetical protein [Clostridiales bacterium]
MAKPIAAMNHIGLSVGDIDKAIDFYKEVFGWYHIAGPFPIKRDGGPSSQFCDTLYAHEGHEWTGFRIAHMVGSNGVGVELLEFEGGYDPEDEFEYKRHGLFHFSVTVPDVDEFMARLKENGGEEYCAYSRRKFNEENTVVTVYGKDPFGNIFEVHSHSYEYMNRM